MTNNNVAYIDGANLHKASKQLGWQLDYKKFRIWLNEKYGVRQAYLFLGLVPRYKAHYTLLQEFGYTLVFKEVVYDGTGQVKGNCDADVVVRAMRDVYEGNYAQVILISSDGDYASLIAFLIEKNKLRTVLSPAIAKKCSVLIKRTGAKIAYINDQRNILENKKTPQNEKTPDTDKTV
jgi:uncharacterized LabA/DUF88 family protein